MSPVLGCLALPSHRCSCWPAPPTHPSTVFEAPRINSYQLIFPHKSNIWRVCRFKRRRVHALLEQTQGGFTQGASCVACLSYGDGRCVVVTRVLSRCFARVEQVRCGVSRQVRPVGKPGG